MSYPVHLRGAVLAVCTHWQEVGWVQAQRHAPYADLDFADEEVVTIYLFAVALEQKRQIKDIHRCRALLAGLVPTPARLRGLRAALEPARGLLSGPSGAVLRDG